MSRVKGVHLTFDERARLREELATGDNPTHVARRLGIDPRTARLEAKRLRGSLRPSAPAAPEPPRGHRLGGSLADRRVVQLEAELATVKQSLRQAHKTSLDDDAIREILGSLAAAPAEPPPWTVRAEIEGGQLQEVPVTIWSDWHAGETVSLAETNGVNAFDLATLERRVRRLVDTTIHLCRSHGPGRYPGIVINLLGDFVSGGLHPELLKTDELEVLPTVLRVRDLLVWALDRMLEAFGQLYCPCAAGNHGRATLKPEFKRYTYKNFDWLLYELLARHYVGRPEIVFDIRPNNEVLYRVHGQRYLALHGDMLGVKGGDGIIGSIGPITRGEMKVGKQAASIGRDYDVLLMGHWHQPLWLPRVIVANALKGFCEYAAKSLRATPSVPSQPLWYVHPRWGKTAHREVLLEDPGLPATTEWTSWPQQRTAA